MIDHNLLDTIQTKEKQQELERLFGASRPRSRHKGGRIKHPALAVWTLKMFDVAAPLMIGYLWYSLYCTSFGQPFWPIYGNFAVVATALSVLVFQLAGCYRTEQFLNLSRTFRTLLFGFACLILIGLTTAFICKSLTDLSRGWTVLWMGCWMAAAAATRGYAVRVYRSRAASGQLSEAIAVVGATAWAERLCNLLAQDPGHVHGNGTGFSIVGIFDDRRERVHPCFAGSTGTLEDLLALGRETHIDRIVLALPLHAYARILEISHRLMALSVDIVACPDLSAFGLLRRPIQFQAGVPAICITNRPIPQGCMLAKSLADKIIAGAMLLLFAPVMLAIAVAIRLTSPGPVLFRQPRLGYNNGEFQVLKFRSMRTAAGDSSGGRQATRADNRVTRLGRFLRRTSLDELPQLFNVLIGDMSLVGPRPLPIGMRTEELFNHEIVEQYAHRHRVRPGITGWAQVNGHRGATEFAQQLQKRVELDLFYIEHWSFLLDAKILFLTGLHLVHSKNAF